MPGSVSSIDVLPSPRAPGAEVRGVDFRAPLTAGQVGAVRAAWAEHLVLLFRDRRLDDEQLLAVADVFGGRQEAGSRAQRVSARRFTRLRRAAPGTPSRP